MRKLIDCFLDLLYPTKCIVCRKRMSPGIPTICPVCRESLPFAVNIHTKGKYLDDCVSAVRYEGKMREAILRYKFGDAQIYHIAFGELVAERIYEDYHGEYDVLSWVPLAPDRKKERGYDQVELMARNVSGRLMVPLVPLLKKRRGVSAQSLASSPEERRANISGAYRVIDPALVQGRRILIIDDVVTTGATLSECAKMLCMAGAEKVLCATLAVATQ